MGDIPALSAAFGILPREILVYELGVRFGDDLGFAFQFNAHLYLFRHLDRVDFSRSLVQGPEVAVDANLSHHALVDGFNRTHVDRTSSYICWDKRRTSKEQHSEAAAYGTVECRHKTHLFATYFHAMLATQA